jgi:NAD(P)-dependent dehydrogenase (short-subunit alcohol dehydrogenase family)
MTTRIDMTMQSEDRFAADRRRFLGGVAMAAGTAAVLGQVAAGSGTAQAAEPAAAVAATVALSQSPQLFDVKGKTAYITGGNTGIGLGIARALSNAGMKVVLGYINEAAVASALKLFKPGNAGVVAIRHDVTDRDGWQKLLAEIKIKFGNLHLLVNNAGIKTLRKASEASPAEWDAATAVNFTGIYNGVAACVPHMRAHGEGSHIVTTASMGGILPGASAGIYTATKFAAVGLMEALRIELEKTNIGTSVFCPGGVSTDNDRSANPELGEAPAGMDPLEAGERVLNGVRNNDLFIMTHPEFKAGIMQRHDALIASIPSEPVPEARLGMERRVLTAPIYAPELAHRRTPRGSYRG